MKERIFGAFEFNGYEMDYEFDTVESYYQCYFIGFEYGIKFKRLYKHDYKELCFTLYNGDHFREHMGSPSMLTMMRDPNETMR